MSEEGKSIEMWISGLAHELDRDAVGLWQIIPTGRDVFRLTGIELTDFVRRCLLTLLNKGAKPVTGSASGKRYWNECKFYGGSSDEIASGMIDEWLSLGQDPKPYDSVWLALPKVFEQERPQNGAAT